MGTVIRFIKNGAEVLHSASRGDYYSINPAILEMKEEIFWNNCPPFLADRKHLAEDKRRISSDVARSFLKVTMSY